MTLTPNQVLALSPDAASATAGRGLANAAKWPTSGVDDALLWGEAQGSGKTPYQTVVALGDLATKCSCPSRKFPCKHALGLMLRHARGEVAAGEPPAWAAEWLAKRGEKATAQGAAPKVADPKTAEKRWATVMRGLDECDAFLRDAVGNGLLALSSARSWDDMAKRMVDAQATGVARRLRRIGSGIGVGADWAPRAAGELGSLALLIEAARNVDALGDLAHDVRTALGIPARGEEAGETVADVWDAVGTFGEEEDRLWTRRTWFLGRKSGRWACHLAFAPTAAPPPPPRVPFGAALAAEARFAPSARPLRAHLEEGEGPPFGSPHGGTWAQAFEAQADALARNPWLDLFPVLLHGATLAREDDRWLVVDAEGVAMPMRAHDEGRNWILAQTGNRPHELFGEFDGETFALVSYYEAEGR